MLPQQQYWPAPFHAKNARKHTGAMRAHEDPAMYETLTRTHRFTGALCAAAYVSIHHARVYYKSDSRIGVRNGGTCSGRVAPCAFLHTEGRGPIHGVRQIRVHTGHACPHRDVIRSSVHVRGTSNRFYLSRGRGSVHARVTSVHTFRCARGYDNSAEKPRNICPAGINSETAARFPANLHKTRNAPLDNSTDTSHGRAARPFPSRAPIISPLADQPAIHAPLFQRHFSSPTPVARRFA